MESLSTSSQVAYIALGSNLGDRRGQLVAAVDLISRTPGVVVTAVSGLYETPAEGMAEEDEAGTFLNAALSARVTISPRALLERLLTVERTLGRAERGKEPGVREGSERGKEPGVREGSERGKEPGRGDAAERGTDAGGQEVARRAREPRGQDGAEGPVGRGAEVQDVGVSAGVGGYRSRVIDLDLLMYGGLVARVEGLEVPHPRMHARRFVLEPLAEIAPDAVHPVIGKTVRELLDGLGDER